jgi:hypothetical protein
MTSWEPGHTELVGKAIGVLLLLAAAASGAMGVLWAVFKTFGSEWDYCGSGGCTSGYVGAALLLGFAAIAGLVGLRLLRG